MHVLTGSMMIIISWPLDVSWKTPGAWIFEVHGRQPLEICMGICQEKRNKCFGGTWDSNPGPNGHMHASLPLHQAVLFVSEISGDYYIEK